MFRAKPLIDMHLANPPLPESLVEDGGGHFFLLKSNAGGFATCSLKDKGPIALLWSYKPTAEQAMQDPRNTMYKMVEEISYRRLSSLVTEMQAAGYNHVMIDRVIEDDSNVTCILLKTNDFLAQLNKIIEDIDHSRLNEDEWIRLIKHAKGLGLAKEPLADLVPVDCDLCGRNLAVHATEYAKWRCRWTEAIHCPHCNQFFSHGKFGKVRCKVCNNESGYFPTSFCENYGRPGNEWTCSQCGTKEAERRINDRIERNQIKSQKSGCLLLFIMIMFSFVTVFYVLII